jgi:tetratricopeptide (TPR) repeat protein
MLRCLRSCSTCFIALSALLCSAVLADDIIVLTSGEEIRGRLAGVSADGITVETGDTKTVLPKSMVRVMKVEVVRVHLSDGRELMGQIAGENEQGIRLRMKLGSITIDRTDIDKLEREVVEKTPGEWEAGGMDQSTRTPVTGLEEIKWPEPTESLSDMEVRHLQWQAAQLLEKKRYRQAADKYREILKTTPREPMVLYDLACACALAGDVNGAAAYLRRAVAAGYADFGRIEHNPDLDMVRSHGAYKSMLKMRDEIQLEAAQKKLDELRRQFGEGYTYEIDEGRKLIFATNQNLEMLRRMKEHLVAVADAQWSSLWDYKPSYYITVVCPDREMYRRVVANPSIAGQYSYHTRSLVSTDIGQTLDHEFTHALHHADEDARRIHAPTYISEGFATLFESSSLSGNELVPRKVSARLHTIRMAAGRNNHIPWDRFCSMSHCQFMQRDSGLKYCQSRYMMVYLWNRGDLKRWYRNYCSSYTRDQTGKLAWEKTCGKPLGEIERDWLNWLEGIKYEPPRGLYWGDWYFGIDFEQYENAVILYKLIPGSPADVCGLREGDILTRAGSKDIRSHNDLVDLLNSHEPGNEVKFEITRGREKMVIAVTLGSKPEGE